MTTTILPQMAQNAFQPLLAHLEINADQRCFSASEARELLMAGDFVSAVVDQIWALVQGQMENGVEGMKFVGLLKDLKPILDIVIDEVYPKIHAAVGCQSMPMLEKEGGLRTIDDHRFRAVDIRERLTRLHDWVDAPWPQVDIAKIIENESGSDAYEDSDDIVARLRAGGDF